MSLANIQIEDIEESHIRGLIDNAVAESRTLDFKRDNYGNTGSDRKEFLADISAFANTAGGDLVIGVEENEGVAIALHPLTDDADAACLRLEQLAIDGLQPRLSRLNIRAVPVGDCSYVLVVRVGKSWKPPHRVTVQNSNRFWMRTGTSKFEPDIDQLRQLFGEGPNLVAAIREFRDERISKLYGRNAVIPLRDEHLFAMHLVPFGSLADSAERLPLGSIGNHLDHFQPAPYRGGVLDWQPNLDGYSYFAGMDETGTSECYTQLRWTGIVEAVRSAIARESDRAQNRASYSYVSTAALEGYIIHALEKYLPGLRELGVDLPIAVFVSLIGLRGVAFGNFTSVGTRIPTFDRQVITLPELIIENWPEDRPQMSNLVHPLCDDLSRAGGRERSLNFNLDGLWSPE